MNDKPKRRWFRYSLRALLVLVTMACVGFGWLGYKMRQAERQKVAVEAIEKLGAIVTYDYETDEDGAVEADGFGMRPTPPGPELLRKLLGDHFFANVTDVRAAGLKSCTDAAWVCFQELTKLKTLDLSETQITDTGLLFLQDLTQLRELDLSGTKVTDEVLVHLDGLTQLRKLNLAGTRVTNAGPHLKRLVRLECLFLSNTQITDVGLTFIKDLPQLKTLYIGTTQVTDAGCRELQKALPNLEIIR